MVRITRTSVMKDSSAKSDEKSHVKPLVPSQRLSTISTKGTMVTTGLDTGSSPTEKKKPGSIHDLLEQMKDTKETPDEKAGKMAIKRWRNAKQIYEEFCTETSFTAITRMYKAKHMYKRVAWLVVCLGMLTWLSVQCYWLFIKYFSYPVEVKIESKAVSLLAFPSVTICNLNPLKKSRMDRGPFASLSETFHLDDSDTLYDDYMKDSFAEMMSDNENITNTAQMTDYQDEIKEHMRERNFNKWDALNNDTEVEEEFYSEMDKGHTASMSYSAEAVKIDDDDIEWYGHKIEDMLISCTWQGMQCSPANFTYLRSNYYGNCYTLNAHDNGEPGLSTTYAGPLMGLSLELNIEQTEYVPALSSAAGMRVVIHNRGTYPFPEDQGFSIPPAFKTSVGLAKTELVRLPPPHADCGTKGVGVDNVYTKLFKTSYTKQTCLKSCYQDIIRSSCGCAFSFYHVPEGVDVCNFNANFSRCMEEFCTTQLQTCNKKCPSPCDDTRYDYTISSAKWPSKQYEEHLLKKINKATSTFMQEDDVSKQTDTLAKIEIYYQDLVYEKVEQQKGYESQNLISDIGGQLGLWLGLSAITVGELIEFLASICRLATHSFMERRQRRREKNGLTKVMPLSEA